MLEKEAIKRLSVCLVSGACGLRCWLSVDAKLYLCRSDERSKVADEGDVSMRQHRSAPGVSLLSTVHRQQLIGWFCRSVVTNHQAVITSEYDDETYSLVG